MGISGVSADQVYYTPKWYPKWVVIFIKKKKRLIKQKPPKV